MIGRAALIIASALLVAAAPAERPSAASLRAGLVGEWSGALGYRDYHSNELFELAVDTMITAVADGVTQVRTSRFDEGPNKAPVWIVTVSVDDPVKSSVTSAAFRKGRAVEPDVEIAEVTAYISPTAWTIVYRRTGTDDDRPADIRVTETRNGPDLLAVKEVSAVGANAWKFRNQTRLRLKRG